MKKIAIIITIVGLCFLVLSFMGCVQKRHKAELYVMSQEIASDDYNGSVPNTIECFGKQYIVKYYSHRFLESTGEKLVTLNVIGTENGRITIDESGNIVKLIKVGNIGNNLRFDMSDSDIQLVIEKSGQKHLLASGWGRLQSGS